MSSKNKNLFLTIPQAGFLSPRLDVDPRGGFYFYKAQSRERQENRAHPIRNINIKITNPSHDGGSQCSHLSKVPYLGSGESSVSRVPALNEFESLAHTKVVRHGVSHEL